MRWCAPPSSFQIGCSSALPLMSHSAMSIRLAAQFHAPMKYLRAVAQKSRVRTSSGRMRIETDDRRRRFAVDELA